MEFMVMIDGPMIENFIENSEEFNKYADEKFELIKQSKQKVVESIAMDGDESQLQDDEFEITAVNSEGFRAELKEMTKAVAQGIGNTPLGVLVREDSFMFKVSEFAAR